MPTSAYGKDVDITVTRMRVFLCSFKLKSSQFKEKY